MSQVSSRPVGGIEAGGTKFVCAIGTGPDDVRAQVQFSTTSPGATLAKAIDFFRASEDAVAAVGIGSFGPVDPDSSSPTFGHITSTPKEGWEDTDFVGPIARELDVPVAFDTDVNAAALGEHRWGAARDVETLLYLTVGTGIGGGVVAGGKRVHGLVHPEVGHIRLPRAAGDGFEGTCPYHGDCLEGMASGPALKARWGAPPETLPPDHSAWEMEAHYLGMALANCVCIFSPERFVLGGGVMHQEQLFPMVRQVVQKELNGYVQAPALLHEIDRYIVPPALGDRAGVLGALALAQEAF